MAKAGETEIDSAIQARDANRVLSLIREACAKPRVFISVKALDSWFEALRKFGLHAEAHDLLLSTQERFTSQGTTGQRAFLFWRARLLAHLGANGTAEKILNSLSPESHSEFMTRGLIRLSRFDSEGALSDFENAEPTEPLKRLALADALAGVGRFEDALAISEKLSLDSEPSTYPFIARQASGEYLARSGKIRRAHKELLFSLEIWPSSHTGVDYGILMKWLYFTSARLGLKSEATRFEREALKHLDARTLRPEALLDFLRVKACVEPASDETLKLLWTYPGFRMDRIQACEALPVLEVPHLVFGETGGVSTKRQVRLFPLSGERVISNQTEWGLKTVDRFIALLARTGSIGINRYRLLEQLWPDVDLDSFELRARLAQLVHQARRAPYLVRIEVQDKWYRLEDLGCVSIDLQRRLPSFLSTPASERFQVSELAKFYSLSRATALRVANVWSQSQRVQRTGKGRGARYLRLSATDGVTGDVGSISDSPFPGFPGP